MYIVILSFGVEWSKTSVGGVSKPIQINPCMNGFKMSTCMLTFSAVFWCVGLEYNGSQENSLEKKK